MIDRVIWTWILLGVWAAGGIPAAPADKSVAPPIQIALEKVRADFDGRLEVQNGYDSTNLAACRFEVQLVELPGPDDPEGRRKAFFRRAFGGPDVSAQGKGWLDLEVPGNWKDADALVLVAFDPQGEELWTWSWFVHDKDHYAEKYVTTEAEEAPGVEVVGAPNEIHLRAGPLVLRFVGNSGELVGVTLDDRPIAFAAGPKLIGGATAPSKVSFSQTGEAVSLNVTYTGEMDYVRWQLCPTGWVRLECQYELEGALQVFGIGFEYPQDRVRGVRWLGRGPDRVWKDRMKGEVLDIHSNTSEDRTPGLKRGVPEFKGYYRDWNWAILETDQGAITIVNATEDLFLALYRPEDSPDPRNTKPNAPDTGIAFLHGIPAIRSRFLNPEAPGLEREKNVAAGKHRTTVWFHFGGVEGPSRPANVRQRTARNGQM